MLLGNPCEETDHSTSGSEPLFWVVRWLGGFSVVGVGRESLASPSGATVCVESEDTCSGWSLLPSRGSRGPNPGHQTSTVLLAADPSRGPQRRCFRWSECLPCVHSVERDSVLPSPDRAELGRVRASKHWPPWHPQHPSWSLSSWFLPVLSTCSLSPSPHGLFNLLCLHTQFLPGGPYAARSPRCNLTPCKPLLSPRVPVTGQRDTDVAGGTVVLPQQPALPALHWLKTALPHWQPKAGCIHHPRGSSPMLTVNS